MIRRRLETEVYYYGARYYDPKISVWLSVDAMAAKDHNKPLMPYHFSANNPVMIIDPDGNDWFVNQETGETLYRPGLGKDDASTLGQNIAWFASNNDIDLSHNDITDGQLVGSYLPSEFEGFNFSTGVSEKIMEKNGYKMVPTLMRENSAETRVFVTSSPEHGFVYSTTTRSNEYWDKVTYAPNYAEITMTGTDIKSSETDHGPGSITQRISRVSTFS